MILIQKASCRIANIHIITNSTTLGCANEGRLLWLLGTWNSDRHWSRFFKPSILDTTDFTNSSCGTTKGSFDFGEDVGDFRRHFADNFAVFFIINVDLALKTPIFRTSIRRIGDSCSKLFLGLEKKRAFLELCHSFLVLCLHLLNVLFQLFYALFCSFTKLVCLPMIQTTNVAFLDLGMFRGVKGGIEESIRKTSKLAA